MKIFRTLLVGSLFAGFTSANDLKPLMAVPGDLVFEQDFEAGQLSKEQWTARQKTRWEVANDVLTGIPSTPETQAARPHHKGLEPRGSAGLTPMNFVAKLSIRYFGDESTAATPFIEFGHHNCRVQFSAEEGAFLLVESESKKVAWSENFTFQPGKWYHILAEMVDDEFVFQIEGGPTFYTRNAAFSKAKEHAVGVAGFRKGKIEIDNFSIWNAKQGAQQNGWEQKKAAIPAFEPVIMENRVAQLKKKKAA